MLCGFGFLWKGKVIEIIEHETESDSWREGGREGGRDKKYN